MSFRKFTYKFYYIYKTTNLVNGKIYIGQRGCNIDINEDVYIGSGKYFKYAVNKYGKENFKKDILEECIKDNVNEREIFWINKFNTTNHEVGYNITKGGDGGPGCRGHSKETRIKISNIAKGRVLSQETKDKIRIYNTGKVMSDDFRKKVSDRMKGREPWNKGVTGTHLSEITCHKMSEAKKGKPSPLKGKPGRIKTEEEKNKISRSSLGKKKTPEHVRKIVESKKLNKLNSK